MLFTKATEAGIQLEIGTMLDSKQIKALKIDVNKKRVVEAARDLHVDVMILGPKSDFQITVGKLLKNSVSELEMRKAKEDLLEASLVICNLICELPDNEDEAILYAEKHTIVNALIARFEDDIKAILGEYVNITVDITAYECKNPEPAASA
jgi:hypothetical protein